MWGHMVVYGHVIMLGHVIGHVVLIWVKDHMISHMPFSQDQVGESLSSLFGYSLA